MFARLLYRFMRAYGVLKSDHEIFVERNGPSSRKLRARFTTCAELSQTTYQAYSHRFTQNVQTDVDSG